MLTRDQNFILLSGLFIGLIIMVKNAKTFKITDVDAQNLTRGERLNNPVNIEKGEAWQGLADAQPDNRFAAFISPEYGIRAFIKILRTYKDKYGLNTLSGIINRYAPATENATANYIAFVSNRTGINPNVAFPFEPNTLFKIASAFINMEQGRIIYPNDVILKGVQMGLA